MFAGILAFDGACMKMVFTLVLGLALLFPAGAQAGECLSRNEIRKMIEQSFYSLYRWQNYWYGYYYDIDLESRIRRDGRMIVDFDKKDFPYGFCIKDEKNNKPIQFAAYLKGVDLLYVGNILNRKSDLQAVSGNAEKKVGEAWYYFNQEVGYRLNIELNAKSLRFATPDLILSENLHKYIRKSVVLSEYKHFFKDGILAGPPREEDPFILIASKDLNHLFLLRLIQFDNERDGQYGEVYSWDVYIYTENLSTDAEKEEKIDKIEKHAKNRLRNDHFLIDCDEC